MSLTTVRAETVEAFLAQLARYSNGARYDADLMARIFTPVTTALLLRHVTEAAARS